MGSDWTRGSARHSKGLGSASAGPARETACGEQAAKGGASASLSTGCHSSELGKESFCIKLSSNQCLAGKSIKQKSDGKETPEFLTQALQEILR